MSVVENSVDKNVWLEKRNEWRSTKTMTKEYEFQTTCSLSDQLLQEAMHGKFIPFSKIIDDFENFKNVVDVIVNSNHIKDEKRPLEFFIDQISVKDIHVVEEMNTISSIGMAVELPTVQHTSVLPYRCVTNDGKMFRCIDTIHNHSDGSFKNKPFKMSNGFLVQEVIPIESGLVNNKEFDLVNDEMIYGYNLNDGDEMIFNVNRDEMRLKMMHMFDVIKNPFPTEQPKWSEVFCKDMGRMKKQFHLKHDCYPTLWVIDKYEDNMSELNLIGATLDEEEYLAHANIFFNKFSHCRFSTFEDGGVFFSVNGMRAPHKISFTMNFQVKFVVDGIPMEAEKKVKEAYEDKLMDHHRNIMSNRLTQNLKKTNPAMPFGKDEE